MFRVIDTIQFNSALYGHHPELRERYASEGLLAILDPSEVTEVPVPAGTVIRIHRPDGSVVEHTSSLSERPSTAVGLFFPHLTEEDIPRLSMLAPIQSPDI